MVARQGIEPCPAGYEPAARTFELTNRMKSKLTVSSDSAKETKKSEGGGIEPPSGAKHPVLQGGAAYSRDFKCRPQETHGYATLNRPSLD